MIEHRRHIEFQLGKPSFANCAVFFNIVQGGGGGG